MINLITIIFIFVSKSFASISHAGKKCENKPLKCLSFWTITKQKPCEYRVGSGMAFWRMNHGFESACSYRQIPSHRVTFNIYFVNWAGLNFWYIRIYALEYTQISICYLSGNLGLVHTLFFIVILMRVHVGVFLIIRICTAVIHIQHSHVSQWTCSTNIA